MRRKTWLLLVASLVAVLALGAAGCGGDDDDDDAAGGDTGAATDGGGQPAAEQVMTIGWGADPPSLDPGIAEDTTSAHLLANLFDPLVKLNPDTLEAEPALAESWDIEGPLVTFHLREDGTWTNGDPVTAGRLRVCVEAGARPGARFRLLVPARRDQGRRRIQQLYVELPGAP